MIRITALIKGFSQHCLLQKKDRGKELLLYHRILASDCQRLACTPQPPELGDMNFCCLKAT